VCFAEFAGVDLEMVAEVGLGDESVVHRRELNGFGGPRAYRAREREEHRGGCG
jgi:hypothetical protein